MDPVATLAAWIAADNSAERAELAEAYNGWIAKGGYPALATVANAEGVHDVMRLAGRWSVVRISQTGARRNVHASLLSLA